jgi:hypothetical protein
MPTITSTLFCQILRLFINKKHRSRRGDKSPGGDYARGRGKDDKSADKKVTGVSAIDQLLSRPSPHQSISKNGADKNYNLTEPKSKERKVELKADIKVEGSSERKPTAAERRMSTATANHVLLNQINNLLKRA